MEFLCCSSKFIILRSPLWGIRRVNNCWEAAISMILSLNSLNLNNIPSNSGIALIPGLTATACGIYVPWVGWNGIGVIDKLPPLMKISNRVPRAYYSYSFLRFLGFCSTSLAWECGPSGLNSSLGSCTLSDLSYWEIVEK